MADLDEDVQGDLAGRPYELVQVFEPESGLVGRGYVSEIDEDERTITLWVDWADLHVSDSSALQSGSVVQGRGINRFVWAADATPGIVEGRNSLLTSNTSLGRPNLVAGVR